MFYVKQELSEVCAVKNENVSFGGIQLVLCGKFHQLAPVPNPLCQEDGEFCFRSHQFTTVLPHKITLTHYENRSIIYRKFNLEKLKIFT